MNNQSLPEVILSRATVTVRRSELGGRFNIRDEHDLDFVADMADRYGFSLACLIAAAEGDGEPLMWIQEEKRGK